MLILFFVICVIVMTVVIYMCEKEYKKAKKERYHLDRDDIYGWHHIMILVIAGLTIFVLTMSIVFTAETVLDSAVIDEKIALYQEQNEEINIQIAEMVENYMKFEKDIIIEVEPESATTLISLYPELKSDVLVESQMEIYMENIKKITNLKDKKISAKKSKWLLYFGK